MIGALWTGISGLAAQQTALDNEAHNIANVNTVGYKSSRISFADQMYQDKIGKGSKITDAENLLGNEDTVLQRSIERSNVNSVHTMVSLIDAHRRFAQSEKAIEAIGEMSAKLIEKLGRV
jgi:flagellar basal body rod protein FlgG